MKSGIVLLVCIALLCTFLLSACTATQTSGKNPVSSLAAESQALSISSTSSVVVESQALSTDSTLSAETSSTATSSSETSSAATSSAAISSKGSSTSAATSSKGSTSGNISVNEKSAKIVIMSQNVRCGDDGNGNDIVDRAPRLKKLIEKYSPDIIGTQETTPTWNKYFRDTFKKTYGMVGKNRDGETATWGEWGTILYKLDRFELLDSDDFWLTDTPTEVSKISGSWCNRICTWALLKDKVTGKTFVFANTHLDVGSESVRVKQFEYLLKGLADLMEQYPVFLTGDFNTTPTSPVYAEAITKFADPYNSAKENRSTVNYTYHAYGTLAPGSLIDFCFYNKNKADAFWYKIADDDFGGYVSDHYGVVGEFLLK